jgi:N-methylhydantoinase B
VSRADDVDPVTLEVLRNACVAVAEEMNATLVRTGYSPNIKERRDCSTALFDADGEMISQAETMPVHLGAMPFSVAAAIEAFPPETLSPGDAVLSNDPFAGGAHLPDLTLLSPVFVEGRVVAYAANRAHHADVGGSRAGSVAANATEIFQEGLRIPPVKFRSGGEVRDDLLEVLLANVRTPDERRGDLRAQVAANATGRRRFEALADRYGAALEPGLEAIKDYSERRMRAEIEALPDGTYEFEDVLDDDGRGNQDLPIRVSVAVDGDQVTVDFAGSADQTAGPVNAVYAVTASATYYAVRAVTDPDIPPNHGCYRPITVETPAASLVDARPPAAVVGGNLETSQRVTDVVLGALAEADVQRVVAACQGTMNNVTFGGTDPRTADASSASAPSDDSPPAGASSTDSPSAGASSADDRSHGSAYAFYETQGGGFGGRAGRDGMDGVHVHMSNTRNTPAEVLETAYPLRVTRYELRPDSGGAGEFRGGLGLRRDIQVRDHVATFSVLADRQRHAPYGLAGGEDGTRGAVWRRLPSTEADADGADETRLAGKSTHDLSPGTVVSIRTPGGGGYGDPDDRDTDAVARDVRLGKVSPAVARAQYGWRADAESPARSDDGASGE